MVPAPGPVRGRSHTVGPLRSWPVQGPPAGPSPRHQPAQEEADVGRLLGHASHEVAVPLVAHRHVHPQLVTAVGDALLLVGADPVEHLVLEGPRVAPVAARERLGDLDQPGVMGGDHGIARARHEDLEAAHVRPVDVGPVLVGDRLRLVVGALAQPNPRAAVGQVAAVAFRAVQVGLQDGAGLREVGPKLADRVEGRVGRRVVLHVDRHGGVCVGRGLADFSGVLQCDLAAVVEEQPHRRELQRDLGSALRGIPLVGEQAQQGEVRVADAFGLLEPQGVLAEVVDGHGAAGEGQVAGCSYGVLEPGTRDEPAHHRAAHRGLLDGVAHPGRPGQVQQRRCAADRSPPPPTL